jgi:metal-dependent amidase/aminoacylase/carboxypeptidase family protein
VVDIKGKLQSEKNEGSISTIALRADMDGLPIPENNPHLDYKS